MAKVTNSLDRIELKSFEGEFLYELQNSYELSPRLSEQILQTAKTSLLRENHLQQGQVQVVVAGLEEKSGKSISKVKKCTVFLTLDNGKEDLLLLYEYGRPALRQQIIQRITEEAISQEGILSQEDLSLLLRCSVRTIKRDISAIKSHGIDVITRGTFHNIGRGQTHKRRIITLYLNGYTYSEIKRKIHHSIGAIKRYLESFSKVLMSLHHGISSNIEISQVTGLSDYLINQYREIINESRKSDTMRNNLSILLEQAQYRSGLKKTIDHVGFQVAAMEVK